VDQILDAGADILRINGAHESSREWAHMTEMFKSRSIAKGKAGRVFVDLPGPKMRAEIGRKQEGVIHLPRHKDHQGRTLSASRVKLVAEQSSGAEIALPANWLAAMCSGDEIVFTDAGGRKRKLLVNLEGDGAIYGECHHSLYITSGLAVTWRRDGTLKGKGRIGQLPYEPGEIELVVGDQFVLNESGECVDKDMPVLSIPEPWVLQQLRLGERVILDDGKLVSMIVAVHADGWLCQVKQTFKANVRLRSGKGISFPDSDLEAGCLGAEDDRALQFALEHADGAEISFVNSADDVRRIGERIRDFGKHGFGMILKLETRGAMKNLISILFEALKYDPVGIMIARGDLAVELSFERLAEMQEELLWFGEACHIPVIWATQVLDSVAHSGLPTRAEVTDAAMAMRAECVMLNKGPYIATAVGMLADIIRKMEAHQFKKRSLYRPLSIATNLS
jgi:pyruvate kinase